MYIMYVQALINLSNLFSGAHFGNTCTSNNGNKSPTVQGSIVSLNSAIMLHSNPLHLSLKQFYVHLGFNHFL